MLFLGVALIVVGLVWFLFGRNFLGLLVVAVGVFILAMDIIKTVRKSLEKKKLKDSQKPIKEAVCFYKSGLPFESGNCSVTLYSQYVLFVVDAKTATLDFSKVTDVSASDGQFSVSYTKDGETKTVLCDYDTAAANSFAAIANHIRSNIKYEL